jgi:preprotein translocase subunit SecG
MYAFLLILHLIICLALVGVVLIQSGKGGGLAGGAFGGSAQTVFGGRGATDVVTRATMVLGVLFFLTSISLALMTTGQRGPTRSLVQEAARKAAATQPQQGQPGGGSPTSPAPAGGSAPASGALPAPATPAPTGGR